MPHHGRNGKGTAGRWRGGAGIAIVFVVAALTTSGSAQGKGCTWGAQVSDDLRDPVSTLHTDVRPPGFWCRNDGIGVELAGPLGAQLSAAYPNQGLSLTEQLLGPREMPAPAANSSPARTPPSRHARRPATKRKHARHRCARQRSGRCAS